jgi:hypothetical protein
LACLPFSVPPTLAEIEPVGFGSMPGLVAPGSELAGCEGDDALVGADALPDALDAADADAALPRVAWAPDAVAAEPDDALAPADAGEPARAPASAPECERAPEREPPSLRNDSETAMVAHDCLNQSWLRLREHEC